MSRDIPMTLTIDGRPLECNAIGPIFYDGRSEPFCLVQAKQPNNDKFALLLKLNAGDVWSVFGRDDRIWGFPSLVERTDGSGTAYLSGQTREMQLRIGENVAGWVSTIKGAA